MAALFFVVDTNETNSIISVIFLNVQFLSKLIRAYLTKYLETILRLTPFGNGCCLLVNKCMSTENSN